MAWLNGGTLSPKGLPKLLEAALFPFEDGDSFSEPIIISMLRSLPLMIH